METRVKIWYSYIQKKQTINRIRITHAMLIWKEGTSYAANHQRLGTCPVS